MCARVHIINKLGAKTEMRPVGRREVDFCLVIGCREAFCDAGNGSFAYSAEQKRLLGEPK